MYENAKDLAEILAKLTKQISIAFLFFIKLSKMIKSPAAAGAF
jgi:hypothetical protein